MTIPDRVRTALTEAMKARDHIRVECLRLLKAALLVKEKESGVPPTESEAVAVLRGEVRKRRQSIEIFEQHGRQAEATAALAEIAVIEEFLPQLLSAEALERRIRTYLAEHPELDHPGKLTGALKRELGDQADGRLLNELCRKVLGA